MKPTAHAIVIYRQKVLLLLRDNKPGIPNPNKWSVLGGEVEEGETYRVALVRELFEEANIKPHNIQFLGMLTVLEGTKHALFLVRLTESEAEDVKLGNEGQRLDFFSFKEITNLPLTKNFSLFFEKYQNELKGLIKENSKILFSSLSV